MQAPNSMTIVVSNF